MKVISYLLQKRLANLKVINFESGYYRRTVKLPINVLSFKVFAGIWVLYLLSRLRINSKILLIIFNSL